MKRREFLNETKRWLLGGSLVALSGVLMYRRKDSDKLACDFNPVCGTCDLFRNCKKPVKKLRMQNGS